MSLESNPETSIPESGQEVLGLESEIRSLDLVEKRIPPKTTHEPPKPSLYGYKKGTLNKRRIKKKPSRAQSNTSLYGQSGCNSSASSITENDPYYQPPDSFNESKPIDLFKPLYKRDRKLKNVSECAASVLNADKIVEQYLATGVTRYKVGSYTVDIEKVKNGGMFKTNFQVYVDGWNEHGRKTQRIDTNYDDIPSYRITVEELPGLLIVPRIVPPAVQRLIVEEVVEDLVPDLRHRNNLDIHYGMGNGLRLFPEVRANGDKAAEEVADPDQLFIDPLSPNSLDHTRLSTYSTPSTSTSSLPISPSPSSSLDPISISLVRNKKLRWITLGGQYNWTSKRYPTFEIGAEGCPKFPALLAKVFGSSMFNTIPSVPSETATDLAPSGSKAPRFIPQAAIINFYSPGDTLSPHQDVAELCRNDLVSVSIGCSAVFYVGSARYKGQSPCQQSCGQSSGQSNGQSNGSDGDINESIEPLQVLVQSGDSITMGQQSRFAFHGVGKVFEDSCPRYLTDDDDNNICLDSLSATQKEDEQKKRNKWALYSDWLSSKRININVRQMI